jgi:thiamine-phosphate pyrophosphorylase
VKHTTEVPGIESGSSSRNRLHGLYAITDSKLLSEDRFRESIESSLKGGTRIIQYRDKSSDTKKRRHQAEVIRSLCDEYQALFIINDDIDLARNIDADGVHLGRDDKSLREARHILGDEAIIGISCYNDIELAIKAEQNSADYVAFGSMFASPTKPGAPAASPDIITRAKQKLKIPVCAIGGITEQNISLLTADNVDMAAVISCLFASSNIEETACNLSRQFV